MTHKLNVMIPPEAQQSCAQGDQIDSEESLIVVVVADHI